MENELDIDFSFKTNSIKQWFNENYYICLYDKFDNFITCFENIEDCRKFLNILPKNFFRALRKGITTYDHQKCKLYVFEKEKDFEIESRGKRR